MESIALCEIGNKVEKNLERTRRCMITCRELGDPLLRFKFLTGDRRMNLPDAPVAQGGFFVTHFFTVRDQ